MHSHAPAKTGPVASTALPPGVLIPVSGPGESPAAGRELSWLVASATLRAAADGGLSWVGPGIDGMALPGASGPVEGLARALHEAPGRLPGDGWAGYLSYALGGWIEPRAAGRPKRGTGLPLAELHRVDFGSPAKARPGGVLHGAGGPVASAQGRRVYVGAVERALAYIRAGDIYQANIAHELRGAFSGSAAGLYRELARGARPRHGMCFLGSPLAPGIGYAVLGLSPELFFSFDATTRRLVTRPMKGTRPGDADPRELRDAEKDRAELAMIVDLMRNDLGRVCEFGSVRVDVPREIEHHGRGGGAVLQATATVSGTVRTGVGLAEILAATFPPGSVTGTPKVRAMQVIDELEPFARGPYCGCLGTFADDGSFELAVSIRTAVVRGRTDPATGEFVDAAFSYCVGAGIVADSTPHAEWEETMAKARVLEPVFELREGGTQGEGRP